MSSICPFRTAVSHLPSTIEKFTRQRVLTASLLAIVIVGLVPLYIYKIAGRMPDYDVYRRAAERALDAEPLYRTDDGHWQFKYLPAFAIVMLPLALGPDTVVRPFWFAISVLILALLLRKTVTVLPERLHSRAYLIGITFVLLGKFYAHEIELGQVNIAMAALVVLALGQMRDGREFAAGLLIAAAIVLKPYSVLLIPWLVARRRLGSIAGAAIGTAAALLLPIVVYGFEGNAHLLSEWWRTVTDTTAPNLADLNNVSAASVFARALGPGRTAQALAAALVLILLAPGRRGVPRPVTRSGAGTARGRTAAHDDADHFPAGVGLRLPAVNRDDHAAGQLSCAVAAGDENSRDRRPRCDCVQHLRPDRPRRVPALHADVDDHDLLPRRDRRRRRAAVAEGGVSCPGAIVSSRLTYQAGDGRRHPGDERPNDTFERLTDRVLHECSAQ